MRRRAAWVLAFLFVPTMAIAQQQAAAAQAAPAQDPDVRVRFPPPSLRIGDVFRIDLRVRLHFDFRAFEEDPDVAFDTFAFRRARVALEGRVFDDFEYQIDAELRDAQHPWRDVYVNYRRFEAFEIQGGKFKVPFGLDQLTSVFNNNFVARTLIGNQLAPGRDRGVMVHGRLADEVVQYQAGWFEHDGDNVEFSEELSENELNPVPAVDGSWAGRVELHPWEPTRGNLRSAQFGVNFTTGTLAEGLYGLRGRTVGGFGFFEPVYVKGQRLRLGVDGRWTPGPFSVTAEYNRVVDERNGQGLGDVDLPDAIAQGWSVAGTWALTGERKAGGIEPRRPLFQGGMGAFEVAARYDELRFSSEDDPAFADEPPFSNPRAANILPNRDRVLTLGGSWYLNRFGRIIFNAIRESIQDPARSPLSDRTTFWSGVVRLQFVM